MVAAAMLALTSCHNKAEDHDHDHEGHDHETENAEHHHSDEITVTPEQAKEAGIEVIEVQPGTFRNVIKTGGRIMAAQGDESVAVAPMSGVVHFTSAITEGKSVGRGTALLTISADKIVDGDPVARARVAFENARKEYERAQKLVESKIISEKDFAKIELDYNNARISYEAIAKGSSQSGKSVSAPIGGFVKSVLVSEGEYVNVGQPLVSVTQNRKLYLRAEVSERYYQYLNSISSANFTTSYDNKSYELDSLGGRLLSTGKSSDGESFFIPVTFEFDNKGNIIPGTYVDVYLQTSAMENVISVPRSALTEEQGLHFVYLQLDEEGYKRQEVTLGADNGVSVQVISGLKAGDKLVTKGAYRVKLASASNAIPAHTHEH
jgi:RND family efflux transporter MFP subunit